MRPVRRSLSRFVFRRALDLFSMGAVLAIVLAVLAIGVVGRGLDASKGDENTKETTILATTGEGGEGKKPNVGALMLSWGPWLKKNNDPSVDPKQQV